MSECCKQGFMWDGTPKGKEDKLADNKAYVTGSNKDRAVLIIHDIYGWTLNNTRVLADHYAKEADATVYVPDFFAGDVVTPETLSDPEKMKAFNLGEFLGKNSKDVRGPELHSCAAALRAQYKKVGAIGFCYGGWAVFQLGAKGKNLVDCISMAHPSLFTKDDIAALAVPTQILAAEHDEQLSPALRDFCNTTIPNLGVEYDYQYFPGMIHGFATRGDPNNAAQKAGLERAKNAAVHWFVQHLD